MSGSVTMVSRLGSTRFQIGQALRLSKNRAAGVDEGVIVRPNPFERGGIPLLRAVRYCSITFVYFLFGGLVVRGTWCLHETRTVTPTKLIKATRSKCFMGLGHSAVCCGIGRKAIRFKRAKSKEQGVGKSEVGSQRSEVAFALPVICPQGTLGRSRNGSV